ncbi:MAG TPA: HAD-IIIA family hydrolase [Kiritimatiellia bacterium]|nr:HAD-IIIA family hydrolase [Kiritimatiellia bacterium]
MKKPCIFFDRDGIVNHAPIKRYVEHIDEFYLQPEFFDSLKIVMERGYVAAIVTNQRGLSTGQIPPEQLEAIHNRILAEVAGRGLSLLKIYFCDASDDDHPRRKPNPGMILEAAEDHNLDLSRSWMIGDNESDVTTGHRAGCRAILVNKHDIPTKADVRLSAMSELPDYLARNLPAVG